MGLGLLGNIDKSRNKAKQANKGRHVDRRMNALPTNRRTQTLIYESSVATRPLRYFLQHNRGGETILCMQFNKYISAGSSVCRLFLLPNVCSNSPFCFFFYFSCRDQCLILFCLLFSLTVIRAPFCFVFIFVFVFVFVCFLPSPDDINKSSVHQQHQRAIEWGKKL